MAQNPPNPRNLFGGHPHIPKDAIVSACAAEIELIDGRHNNNNDVMNQLRVICDKCTIVINQCIAGREACVRENDVVAVAVLNSMIQENTAKRQHYLDRLQNY